MCTLTSKSWGGVGGGGGIADSTLKILVVFRVYSDVRAVAGVGVCYRFNIEDLSCLSCLL